MTFIVKGFIMSRCLSKDMTKRNEEQIIAAITHMADELGGTIETTTTFDSSKRTSKKIVVEYDVRVDGEPV